MVLSDPRLDLLPERFGNHPHFSGFGIGHSVGALVVSHITFLAKRVKPRDSFGAHPSGELKRMDYSIVMLGTRGLISCCRESSGRKLQRRIVGNVELPIGNEPQRAACLKVPIGDGQQVGDFLAGRFVLPHPTEFEPVL